VNQIVFLLSSRAAKRISIVRRKNGGVVELSHIQNQRAPAEARPIGNRVKLEKIDFRGGVKKRQKNDKRTQKGHQTVLFIYRMKQLCHRVCYS
jgi:hypothetical protein